jgi:PAS domain S-box-containing protein
MQDEDKTKEQLIAELHELRQRLAESEKDITERKEIEAGLEKTRQELAVLKIAADEGSEFAESVINTVREPLIALDQDLRVVKVSRSFYEFFKVKPEETVGRLIYDLGNKQWDIPKLRELLETILPQKATFNNYEVEHDFTGIGRRVMLLNARQIQRGLGKERIILLAIEDITEHKRLESLLTESEERYRQLFETASDGIVLLEKCEGKITHANPATENMLGYAKEECVGNSLQDIGISLDMGDFQTTMQDLNRAGIVYYNDVPVKTKSGQHIDTDIYLADRSTLVQCNIRDVTERKGAEVNLKESKALTEAVVENVPLMIFLKESTDLRFVMFNRAGEELLGYDRRDLIGKNNLDLFPPEQAAHFMAKDREVLDGETGMLDIPEEPILTAKKGLRLLHTRKVCIRGSDGATKFLLGISEDITERKQAEDSLRETSNFLENLLEYANAPIIVWDSQFKIMRFNRAFERLTGRKSGDVLGLGLDFLFPPEKRTGALEYIQSTSIGERWETVEISIQHVDGSVHTLLWNSAMLYGTDGKTIVATIAQGHDITERRQALDAQRKLEAQLAQSQKMEAIGTLAGGIAHDFNNILGIIFGFTEISLSETSRTTPLGQNLEQILKAAHRAKHLVQQILSFGRKAQTERIPLNASPLIIEALNMLRASLPTTIEICIDIEATCEVQADPTQVHQVVVNLCTNAAHAMKEDGGILRISLGSIDFDASVPHLDLSPGPYIKLSVSDTGKGMTPEVVSRIFDPFFTTKGPHEGTGLGLSVVYGIVRSHQGAITVDSEPGKGSTFNVFLPRIEIRDAFEPEIVMKPPTGEEQILLVDDERALTDIGRLMLETLGYKVESFTSSVEALKAFEAQPDKFDLVITDMTMPHMTGIKLAKELMRLRPQIPVILCSGFSDLITPEKAREMGIKTMLIKPVSLAELAKTVRQILDDK